MTDAQLQINLNLAALWSQFFIKLQHLLDGVGEVRGFQAQANLIRQYLPQFLWPENFFK